MAKQCRGIQPGSKGSPCLCPGLKTAPNNNLCLQCDHTIAKHGSKESLAFKPSSQSIMETVSSASKVRAVLEGTKLPSKRISKPTARLLSQREELDIAKKEANKGYKKTGILVIKFSLTL